MKYQDRSYSLYPTTGGGRGIKVERSEGDKYFHKEVSGWVETPNGFVRIYASWFKQYGVREREDSNLEMIKDGKMHYRRFDRIYSPRYLVTLAKRFSKELFE